MHDATQAIDALYGLGHWLMEQKRTSDALHVFRTLMMSAPDDERGWLGLGVCHEELGHDVVARDLYTLAAASIPLSFRCSLAQARILRRLGASHLADDAYDAAIDRAETLDQHQIAHAIAHERLAS